MHITENIVEILTKYLLTINNYNQFFFKNISIYNNPIFIKNLHIKGLTIIHNIFNISLLYLDSLADIYNLCEKGYIYFIEFINQINITNSYESNSFELTLKDAVIFSYKKTLFTFNTNIKINISEFNKFKLEIINQFIYIINNLSIIIFTNIYHYDDIKNNLENNITQLINYYTLDLSKLIKKIFNYTDITTKQIKINNNYIYYINNINSFINCVYINYELYNSFTNKELTTNIIIFIEKYITKKIFFKKINFFDYFNDNSFNLLEKYENIPSLLNLLCKNYLI
tara:strand:+ start:6266 stop:7117 length:852 start_codon:yes stop_codon:yes gene_type:complete